MINDISFYSEQGLQQIAHDQIWNGKGTESDPFIIQNANILGQAILIKNSSLYISFINCNFNHAQFEGCCNILLKDCTFEKLVLRRSKNFKINTSYISDIELSRTKQITFKKSIIINISTKFKRIKNITLEDCQINNDFLNYILNNNNRGFYPKIKEIIQSIIILFIYLIFYRLYWRTYDLESSDIVNVLLIFGLTVFLLLFLLFSFFCHCLVKRKNPKLLISANKSI